MSKSYRNREQAVRELAYHIWEDEGRPEGRALDHCRYATIQDFGDERLRSDEPMEDEEKILAGRPDANIPPLLTKGVHGG
jgi:Protein of unknown function (DUF2934)